VLGYPGHYDLRCELKELGSFSGEKMKFGKTEIAPRAMLSKIFAGKFASKEAGRQPHASESVRVGESHRPSRIAGRTTQGTRSFLDRVDHDDPKIDMSAMVRTTAFPASIVVQMLASGPISKRGGVLEESDCPGGSIFKQKWRSAELRSTTRSSEARLHGPLTLKKTAQH
jgi:saccharopine dehydrogenase-like NADP-dependent oxidoreductase